MNRRAVAAAGLAFGALASFVVGASIAGAVLLVVGVAVVLPAAPGGPVASVPSALVLLIGASLGLGELTNQIGWRALASPIFSRATLCAASLLVMVVAISHMGRPSTKRIDLHAIPPVLPGVVMFLYGVFISWMPLAAQVQWFLNGDNVRHLIFVVDLWSSGSLDYASESYPRAWHSLLALLWSAQGASLNYAGFAGLLELNASAFWLLYAAVALITGTLAADLAGRLELTGLSRSLIGVWAGSAALSVPFAGVYMANGFQNSAVAALVLAVSAWEVLVGRSSGRGLALTAAGVAVMANTWQLLLPAALVAFAVASYKHAQGGAPRDQLAVAAAWVVAALIAAPGLVAVVTKVGIDHAIEAGVVAPLPSVWLVLVGLAASTTLVRLRGDLEIVTLAVMIGGTILSALLVAAISGIPPSQYYPSKMLWQGTILGIPLVCVMVGAGLSRLTPRSRAPQHAVITAGVVVVATGSFAWMASPIAAALGKWSSVDPDAVLAVMATPQAGMAQVVWTGDPEDDTISRILLDFYRVGETRTRTLQHPLNMDEECFLLRSSSRPAVLARSQRQDVTTRYKCAPGVNTIRVSTTGSPRVSSPHLG